MTFAQRLADQLHGSREWTLKLIADLKGDDWFFQPAPGLAHPLWLCGHLTVSQNTLVHVRCLGRSMLADAFVAHFPIGGPVKSAAEHAYPHVSEVLADMEDMHNATMEAVQHMNEALLAEPAYAADGKSPHPHYRDKAGAIVHSARHEAFHAGQIALIRRLLGKSFLR